MKFSNPILKSFRVTLILIVFIYIPWTSTQNCPSDSFGWQCRYTCLCNGTCNSVTGYCENCPGMSWGPGCLLDSICTYNDSLGIQYQGKRSFDDSRRTCIMWHPPKRGFTGDKFPDKDLHKAVNYCRNPKDGSGYSRSPWCYFNPSLNYGYCSLPRCNCTRGRFGVNCLSECHCKHPENTCDLASGRCPAGECHEHFQGSSCQDCKDRQFGVHCDKVCRCEDRDEVCNKSTGFCSSGCYAGLMGIDCQTECPEGQYGRNCNSNCSVHCNPPAQCDRKTGSCPCKAGYQPPMCVQECPHGKYGLNCTRTCSENCDPARRCHKTFGTCPCKAGYLPPICVDECPQGKYGFNCTHYCSGNCDPGRHCDKTSGTCVCKAGYEGSLCVDACQDGRFGVNCTATCNCHNQTEVCEKASGICRQSGCRIGWHDASCQKEYRSTECGTGLWAITGIFAALFLTTLTMLFITCLRNRPRSSKTQSNEIPEDMTMPPGHTSAKEQAIGTDLYENIAVEEEEPRTYERLHFNKDRR